MIISPAKRLLEVKQYYFAQKLADIDIMNNDGHAQVINLGIGSPDLPPPLEIIEKLSYASKAENAHKYQPYNGIPMLRNAIGHWYKNHFDYNITKEQQILPLAGSKEGIMHVSMSFLNPGDQVLVPNPGYPAYGACTTLAGGIVIDMPLCKDSGWKPDLTEMAKMDLTDVKLMWINYPNMPTGAKADVTFFEELVAFATRHKILICHDNAYSLLSKDRPLSIFNAIGAENCAIELMSLSKCYNMAGWRVGAIVGSKSYLDAILKFKSNMDSGMFKPIQEAATLALAIDKSWINGLKQAYHDRKIFAYKIMDSLGLEYELDGDGLFVWGQIKAEPFDSETFSNKLLKEKRVYITPGHVFGSEGRNFLRISLCSPVSDLEAALYRIKTGFSMIDTNSPL